MSIVYFENQFLPQEEARIPITDRGFQFGDGAYATIQVKDGELLFLEAHLEQLTRQCLQFNLTCPPLSATIIEELIHQNKAYEGIWRLRIFVTGGDSSEMRLPTRTGRLLMMLHPFTLKPFAPLKMELFPIPFSCCHASFKSLAHLNRYYVMEEAYKRGVDDCITQTETGILLEAAFGNLFWVKDKTFMTPDPSLPLYFGVTITTIVKLAQELGFEIAYVKFKHKELPQDAAYFRTNTMHGVRPIVQIGTTPFKRNQTLETLFINGYEKRSVAAGAATALEIN